MSTPREEGFRMPAEWEPQDAVWLTWPVNESTWPGIFERIPRKFAEIAAIISRHEAVRINCPGPVQEAARICLRTAGAEMARISLFDHASNDAWCRDHGPIFVRNDRTGEVAVTDWKFNAWGGKYLPCDEDDAIPRLVAEARGLRRFAAPVVMEGGSLEVDGRGNLLTTAQCLLNPNRNPGWARERIEEVLRDYLGAERIYWLDRGIAGDDTDGHIDDLTRFLPSGGIVTAVSEDENDADYRPLRENVERLKSFRDSLGKHFDLTLLPMPAPVFFKGERLPASYANYLVINDAVLVPTFSQPERDARALELLRACFPGRMVYSVDCADLVVGLGALHCISQQEPLAFVPTP